ncbi:MULTISPECIES: ABC transporter permease [unclassified Brenneria]|uniref:ABC transporter permease n=1 Tax=unclassified Brenneria TaxID=2634434 RepID=UPI0029C1046B|nr:MULTISPECIES: ABC transporter permease [unclassified Brenneria]MDX5627037.1 ABC transporter permease [Brenneria sp. L3-3Z]MDX5693613.1 ABC transporter permease [Brenneria sp. L4-2C]MEE3663516.1 ABC transporter permease [Brenneria sp. g21c3]
MSDVTQRTPLRRESYLREVWRNYRRSRIACLALLVLVIAVLMALFAPWITPQNPFDQSILELADARLSPGSIGSGGYVHVLGTDADGRDLYSAIVYGMRLSMTIGLISGLAAMIIGSLIGLMAGFVGGRAEALLMRIVDLQLSFPPLMLALVLVAMLGQGQFQVIAALVAAQYAYFARTVHGAALAERQKEYIEAAGALPLPARRIMFGHLLPNVLPPLIVVASVQIASSIVLEATLSFLGVGLPVTEPSLGGLIYRGFEYMLSGRYWMSVYPGVTLVILMLAINLVGDQLRDVLNPRLNK